MEAAIAKVLFTIALARGDQPTTPTQFGVPFGAVRRRSGADANGEGSRRSRSCQRLPRRRRASFVLTSLIDVIFLLVIFFMVSSQITPFSHDRARPHRRAGRRRALARDAALDIRPVSLRIMAGSVRIAGKLVAMDGLDAALAALKASGVTALIC